MLKENDHDITAQADAIDTTAHAYAKAMWQALGGDPRDAEHLAFTGAEAFDSAFAVTDFAAASIGVAGLAVAELAGLRTDAHAAVRIDRRLASWWFASTLQPQGWSPPPLWDSLAGDYPCADGWIRLHTNAPHHRAAALRVLGTRGERDTVARAVAQWQADALEAAIVENHGCAAVMRNPSEWARHPQGLALQAEPLLHRVTRGAPASNGWEPEPRRPLRGIRVLDLTRVLAGPIATRFLAGFGAQVLRIDPPDWDEPAVIPEVVPGKRCARLDLKQSGNLHILETLLSEADVLVHGYRPDALPRLGLDAARRRQLNPGLIDVSLNAYGWSGPWRGRRGFDSLVQMSTGIAEAGMRALDHATGYLLAAAAMRGLTQRLQDGTGSEVRAALARIAQLLVGAPRTANRFEPLHHVGPEDIDETIEQTGWGPALRLRPPVTIDGVPLQWDIPARALGSYPATWKSAAV
ncbi:hypothetical protein DFQ30_002369 [Apophysomyces sp. BC1015]|nr:hypothetical protein DFQ30_002369 [Apophysomyces sp. BC1015]